MRRRENGGKGKLGRKVGGGGEGGRVKEGEEGESTNNKNSLSFRAPLHKI